MGGRGPDLSTLSVAHAAREGCCLPEGVEFYWPELGFSFPETVAKRACPARLSQCRKPRLVLLGFPSPALLSNVLLRPNAQPADLPPSRGACGEPAWLRRPGWGHLGPSSLALGSRGLWRAGLGQTQSRTVTAHAVSLVPQSCVCSYTTVPEEEPGGGCVLERSHPAETRHPADSCKGNWVLRRLARWATTLFQTTALTGWGWLQTPPTGDAFTQPWRGRGAFPQPPALVRPP